MANLITKLTMAGILLFSPLSSFAGGVQESEIEYVYGTVLDEGGSIVTGNVIGNSSDKGTYAVKIQTEKGIYYMQIDRCWGGMYNLDALNLAINKGTNIKIPKSEFEANLNGNVGFICSNHIEVLQEE